MRRRALSGVHRDTRSAERFYRPSTQGVERRLGERLRRLWARRKPEDTEPDPEDD